MSGMLYIQQGLKRYQFWGDRWVRQGWRVQDHVLSGQTRLLNPDGRIVMQGSTGECRARAESLAPRWSHKRAVILLHALAGSPGLLHPLDQRLEQRNYAVVNLAYPNLFECMEDHARRVRAIADQMAGEGVTEVSFIAHSLGGLVVRSTLRQALPMDLGRVVFLGTPNQGSSLGERLHRLGVYQAFFGPSGLEILADPVSRLPLPDAEMLVVAGGNGRRGYNPLLVGDNDGIVTVAETRLSGIHHYFMRVPCLHRYLPRHRAVGESVVQFIETGRMP